MSILKIKLSTESNHQTDSRNFWETNSLSRRSVATFAQILLREMSLLRLVWFLFSSFLHSLSYKPRQSALLEGFTIKMNDALIFESLFLIFLFANLVLGFYLYLREAKSIKEHRNKVPHVFSGLVSLDAHKAASDARLHADKVNEIRHLEFSFGASADLRRRNHLVFYFADESAWERSFHTDSFCFGRCFSISGN